MKKILTGLGAIIIIGTAGACDLDKITIAQAVKQCLIGLPMVVIGRM